MTQTCPAGHESAATDYCDTCGIAMGAPAAAPPPLPADPSIDDTGKLPVTPPADGPASGDCPSCGTTNPPNALFCENCGYDFTTGSLPRPVDPAPSALDLPADLPVDPPVVAPVAENSSPPPSGTWVAEIWIDPDWYADQASTDPLPSPGVPIVTALRHSSILIGRASRSRGISPDLDLGTDTGISRRHAQLTTDGSRWFVEDLGSSNGTYVGGALGALPKTPVPPGQKVEIRPDERVYVGAWTRIVIRKAAPGEV
ncbi:FHA domain-containing protein [Nocardioides sp.]|uniref:FHA domain-containing protein n=1 Tax=Nocardioides sp. TaxID=35761 RepID=UPI0027275CAD|nr:FHA domain-containing protein [Nocardioides sp.]MDO9456635.1 FHA domain-containing protein [Nocardioides sp.]